MGQDKAFVEVGGRPMAAIAADALRAAGAAEVIAVGGDLARLTALGFDRAVADEHPGEGPLAGLLTALGAATDDIAVVLACDLPFADPAAIRLVLEAVGGHDAAMVRTDRLEPLHAAWRRVRCLPVLAAAFDAGERAVHRSLDGLVVAEVTVADPSVLHNANRPGDLPR